MDTDSAVRAVVAFPQFERDDRHWLESIRASERDILHGAALAAAELPEPEEGAAPPGAYTCC